MTIHAAKGLEFPYVYIVGLEDKLFPSYMVNSQAEMEEERRLFYVAITRTKQCLTLSYAESRFMFGNLNFCRPSSFLMEIDKHLIEQPLSNFSKPMFSEPKNLSMPKPIEQKKILSKPIMQKTTSSATPPSKENLNLGAEITHLQQLKIGMKVFHDKFGIGSIEELIEEGPNSKTIIAFEQFGVKTMLLRFAKLKIIQS